MVTSSRSLTLLTGDFAMTTLSKVGKTTRNRAVDDVRRAMRNYSTFFKEERLVSNFDEMVQETRGILVSARINSGKTTAKVNKFLNEMKANSMLVKQASSRPYMGISPTTPPKCLKTTEPRIMFP